MEEDLLENFTTEEQDTNLENLSTSSLSETNTELNSFISTPEDSFSKLNTIKLKNPNKFKNKRKKTTNENLKKDTFESLTIPDTEHPITILDRFMNYVESLIKKLVNKLIGLLETNHESNFNFFLSLLFKKRKKNNKSSKDKE